MIPPRLLKVWLTLLLTVFLVSSTLFAFLGTPISIVGAGSSAGWLDPVIAGALLALGTSPLAFVLSALKSGAEIGARFDETRCPDCEYDLTGLDPDRCPECGRAIDRS
jgi:hypothetical protein